MIEVTDAAPLRHTLSEARGDGRTIGLVPTMGFLHAGHCRLIEAARAENDVVVLSIFVNPTQFGPTEDLDRYPRDLEHDRAVAEDTGVDIVFAPDERTVYPDGVERQTIWIDPGDLARHLDGASRPGHFRGVATVVAKLLNLVQPDRAYFGQKDAQQLVIIQRMVRDLAFPVEIRAVQTERESDGLALSSRNVYLTASERAEAIVLASSLGLAREEIAAGERDAGRITSSMQSLIERKAPQARIDFITIADLMSLQPITGTITSDILIALAVYFGSTRLIDNVIVRFAEGEPRFT